MGVKARTTLALALATFAFASATASAAPVLSVDDASKAEPVGNANATMRFKVTLSEKSKRTVKADYRTVAGTATTLDYRQDFGTVKIKPGKAAARIPVTIRGDLFAEPDETFTLALSRAGGASIGDGDATGTILANDDGPDADGDDIPDSDDCAVNDPNPEGQVECFIPTTIYDVNQGEVAPGTRAYIPNVLATSEPGGRTGYGAIIPGDPGYAGQDFSAIELRHSNVFLDQGERATVIGTVREDHFYVLDKLDGGSCCEAVPDPISLTPAELLAAGDALNGLLVEIEQVTIASSTRDEWLLEEGPRVVDTLIGDLPQFEPGTGFEFVRGHARTRDAGANSLAPRNLSDFDPDVAQLTSIGAVDTCLLPGEQDVTVATVFIDEAQAENTVITLTSSDTDVLTLPPTVTVLAGNTSADIVADAGEEEGFAIVTASLGPFDESSFVDVFESC